MITGGKGAGVRNRAKTPGREKTPKPRRHPSPGSRALPHGIVVLHEDRDILIVDKPPGLLTMGSERNRVRTAYYVLTDYVRKGNPKSRNRVFIVHRLDRETSGILVFAKSESAKQSLQGNWENTQKTYAAVVHGRCKNSSGTISSYLAENAAHSVYSTPDVQKGKLASTAYKVLKSTDDFSLLEVDLQTGRKHQIRVHLADAGFPVVGDSKYGKRGAHKRLALHAVSLSFAHPFNGRPVSFETRVPGYFEWLVSGKAMAGEQGSLASSAKGGVDAASSPSGERAKGKKAKKHASRRKRPSKRTRT